MVWQELFTSDGTPYYHDDASGCVQWERPADFAGGGGGGGRGGGEAESKGGGGGGRGGGGGGRGGNWVWIRDEKEAFLMAQQTQKRAGGRKVEVTLEDGSSRTIPAGDIYEAIASTDRLRQLPDDLVQLDDVNEASIVHTLRQRFLQNFIYTNIGTILVSVNPFRLLPLYTPMILREYKSGNPFDLRPHAYGIAAAAYRALMETLDSQAILISGESGAGKTEATKLCLNYLSEAAGSADGVEQKILGSNPILEAFGNARTLRNNNSSRFGKFMRLFFDERGKIVGCSTTNYLLEKVRVVRQNQGERNFHIFYQLCRAAVGEAGGGGGGRTARPRSMAEYASRSSTSARRDVQHPPLTPLGFTQPEKFDVLNRSGCTTIEGMDDSTEFLEMRAAFDNLEVGADEQYDIYTICATVLHLGNLRFRDMMDGSTERSDILGDANVQQALNLSSNLLAIDPQELATKLRTRELVVRGETSHIQLKAEQAADARDALSKALYSKAFDWLVERINIAMNAIDNQPRSIGILDIFGFEIFDVNSFEQLCINFANEKLQQHFNAHTFKAEEQTYLEEGIQFDQVPYIDNQDVLDLIEKKPVGILPLLDEEIVLPQTTDQSFLQKCNQQHSSNPRYGTPGGETGRTAFLLNHYAGGVTYDVTGFLDKNKDTLSPDLLQMLAGAGNQFVSQRLFAADAAEAGTDSRKRKISAGGKFKAQLNELMTTLNTSAPHYIRCIKPNDQKAPQMFQGHMCHHQLQCSGVFEAVTIRRQGYPFRLPHKAFYRRFRPLVRDKVRAETANDYKSAVRKVLDALARLPGLEPVTETQLGNTMVFWKSNVDKPLSARRALFAEECAKRIQHLLRGFLARRLIAHIRRVRPLLIAALQSQDLGQIDAALQQSGPLRFHPREHDLLVEHREVIVETERVKKAMITLAQKTINDIDDAFEEVVLAGRKYNVNTPEASRVYELYAQVEDKRKAIRALRAAVESDEVTSEMLRDALQQAEAIKGKYGAGFCQAEEAKARDLLRHVEREEQLVQAVSAQLNLPAKDVRPSALHEAVIAVRQHGCRTQRGKFLLRLGAFMDDIIRMFDDGRTKCQHGEGAVLAADGSVVPAAGGMKNADMWSELESTLEMGSEGVLDDKCPIAEISQLQNRLHGEVKRLRETIDRYRAVRENVRATAAADENAMRGTIAELQEFNASYGEMFVVEVRALQAILEQIERERLLLTGLQQGLATGAITLPFTPEGQPVQAPDPGTIDTIVLDQALEQASSITTFRSKEVEALVRIGGFISRLRIATRDALGLNAQAQHARNYDTLKAAWDAVQAVVQETVNFQNLQGWSPAESDAANELILSQSVANDVKERVEEAMAREDWDALYVCVRQAEQLDLGNHPDESIRSVILEGMARISHLRVVFDCIDAALTIGMVSPRSVRRALRAAAEHDYRGDRLGLLADKLEFAEDCERRARAAWQGIDREEMIEAVIISDRLGVTCDDVELARYLTEEDSEKSFLQRLLKLNQFLGREEEVVDITIRLKGIFFRQAGAMLSFERYSKLRTPDDYGRSASSFGFRDNKLAATMLRHTADPIPTSLTILGDDAVRQAQSIFQCILGYMGDRVYSYPPMLAQELLRLGAVTAEMRDEVYCQLMKQLSGNHSATSESKGIDLLTLVLRSFPPSTMLSSFVEYFLREKNYTDALRMMHSVSQDPTVHVMNLAEIGQASGVQICTGWLRQRGKGRLSKSKLLWFMLEGVVLRYWEEEESFQQAIGQYDLSEAESIISRTGEDDAEREHFAFEIKFADWELILVAANSEDRMKWVKTLSAAKQQHYDNLMSMRFENPPELR